MGLLRSDHSVLVDSSAWISLVLSGERDHERCKHVYFLLKENRDLLFTTDGILSETLTRLRYRAGFHHAEHFYERIRASLKNRELTLLWSKPEFFEEAWKIMSKYRDHALSFVDCLAAVSARSQRIKRVFTLDRDFAVLGFTIMG